MWKKDWNWSKKKENRKKHEKHFTKKERTKKYTFLNFFVRVTPANINQNVEIIFK